MLFLYPVIMLLLPKEPLYSHMFTENVEFHFCLTLTCFLAIAICLFCDN